MHRRGFDLSVAMMYVGLEGSLLKGVDTMYQNIFIGVGAVVLLAVVVYLFRCVVWYLDSLFDNFFG